VNVHAFPPPAAARPREMRREPRFKLPARLMIDDISIDVID